MPTRRSFLVTLGSFILGRFALPSVGDAFGATQTTETAAEAATDANQARRLLTLPTWERGRNVMIWSEMTNDATAKTKIWVIETPEEEAEASRFYDAAHWRSWRTHEELAALLRTPGPCLIRYNAIVSLMFFSTDDEKVLFGPGSDDTPVLTNDPKEAVVFGSQRALTLIPRLMVEFNLVGSQYYLEPVNPVEPLANLRPQELG